MAKKIHNPDRFRGTGSLVERFELSDQSKEKIRLVLPKAKPGNISQFINESENICEITNDLKTSFDVSPETSQIEDEIHSVKKSASQLISLLSNFHLQTEEQIQLGYILSHNHLPADSYPQTLIADLDQLQKACEGILPSLKGKPGRPQQDIFFGNEIAKSFKSHIPEYKISSGSNSSFVKVLEILLADIGIDSGARHVAKKIQRG